MSKDPDPKMNWVQVTSYDPLTGEGETARLDPHSYILVYGEFCEVAAVQRYANGTTQITLKVKKDAGQ